MYDNLINAVKESTYTGIKVILKERREK